MTPDKYPAAFDNATHGLVLRASSWERHLFVCCRITRRPAGMICIENAGGQTFTFSIQRDEKGKEFGHLIQSGQGYDGRGTPPKRFRVIPFNPDEGLKTGKNR